MNEGISAIIRQIDSDATRHSGDRLDHMKAAIDREIERENALIRADIEQRRDILLTNSKHEMRHRLERYSRRLNRELLTYRRELLNELFDMAVRKLSSISEEEYSDVFLSAIKDLSGCFTLYIGEYSQDKLRTQTIENAVKALPGLEIKISPDVVAQKSGFVIMDSRVEYNYLFEDFIEDMKSEQAAKILKEVFEED